MQLRLPWSAPKVTSPRVITIDGRTFDVEIVRRRGARRYVLRMSPSGALRLTVPRGASIAGGLTFISRQHDWIRRESQRQSERSAPWLSGTEFFFRGAIVTLAVTGGFASFAGERVRVKNDVAAAVRAQMIALAKSELPPRCLSLADNHALKVSRVSIRNQRSRWGSCSSSGSIALNWRLIQMPPRVSDYVMLHELMHLRHANHSRRFWREVEGVCPEWREAERWLRTNGRQIL